jgi:hypothetical protein
MQGEDILSTLMENVICYIFEEEDILEHNDGKCHVLSFLYANGGYSWAYYVMASATLVNL